MREVEETYEEFMADAAKRTRSLEGLPLMLRNQHALMAAMRSKAECAVASKRRRESQLSSTAHVDRSSEFVPQSELRERALRCAVVHNLFKFTTCS